MYAIRSYYEPEQDIVKASLDQPDSIKPQTFILRGEVVAGSEVRSFKPCGSNQQLWLEMPASLTDQAIDYAKTQSSDKAQQVKDTCDMLAVNIGKEILQTIPGRISTEVDARITSYNVCYTKLLR